MRLHTHTHGATRPQKTVYFVILGTVAPGCSAADPFMTERQSAPGKFWPAASRLQNEELNCNTAHKPDSIERAFNEPCYIVYTEKGHA
ncbi:hypothetical protein L210DRAFT_3587229 [Boletus edulis BED1]|uniref:Uncharacterized protein n=1 Tax=Boletus edulis BED1 TaxID=1328754 RepID=A0AAD4G642_BOLED|nr:hypothetical protein L210DRAFT_3587229 [Boletus edulis BED1]